MVKNVSDRQHRFVTWNLALKLDVNVVHIAIVLGVTHVHLTHACPSSKRI